ncbi:MAG: D-hexose-6-phosphate mutarotase [Verrucomicrobiota bacterium]
MSDLASFEISGSLAISPGLGGLPVVRINSPWSSAEIYLHGAHVTAFQKNGEAPLLFMSGASHFEPGMPIRGGIPIIFPWFGARDGHPAHGTARIAAWELFATSVLPDQSVQASLRLPDDGPLAATYHVTVGASLRLELVVENSAETEQSFETCLHTYFHVGDIDEVSIHGLSGNTYLDKVLTGNHVQAEEPLLITGETDRVYQDSVTPVEILDPTVRRRIRIGKSGSRSTVVWNPWIAKSKAMPDFGDDEYPHMVCVESGNVGPDRVTLAASEQATLTVEIFSGPID